MKIEVIRYNPTLKNLWDDFLNLAKNGLFLFKRDYMEYHQDRFQDFSLMIYCDEQLVALLPANIDGATLYSHQGLTYGGLIYSREISSITILAIFDCLKSFFVTNKIKCFVYKAIPHIFHQLPAEEDLYGLFRSNAHLYRVDLSSVIDLNNLISFSSGKSYGLRKAKSSDLKIENSTEFEYFFNEIVSPSLHKKYNISAVHTPDEMRFLHQKFPSEIILYVTKSQGKIVAGSVIYVFKTTIHLQYLFSNEEGQKLRAIELLLDFLITKYQQEKRYLSFGISTQNDGEILNNGLIRYKEEFGARATVNNHYRINFEA